MSNFYNKNKTKKGKKAVIRKWVPLTPEEDRQIQRAKTGRVMDRLYRKEKMGKTLKHVSKKKKK